MNYIILYLISVYKILGFGEEQFKCSKYYCINK